MINIIPSEARFTAEHGWLKSRFSFSFAEYYDPANLEFGPLRVFNDDTVQPGTGFGKHPHANFEIMSYVLEGTLEHQDSMGNRGQLKAGEIQCTTAGTGIYHSEYNPSSSEPVHFLQIWFNPDERNLTPSWKQRAFPKETQVNGLLPVVSGQASSDTLQVHQDVTVYLSVLEADREVLHQQAPGRKMYVFVIQGELVLNETGVMRQGDSARIEDLSELRLKTKQGAEFMLMDLA